MQLTRSTFVWAFVSLVLLGLVLLGLAQFAIHSGAFDRLMSSPAAFVVIFVSGSLAIFGSAYALLRMRGTLRALERKDRVLGLGTMIGNGMLGLGLLAVVLAMASGSLSLMKGAAVLSAVGLGLIILAGLLRLAVADRAQTK